MNDGAAATTEPAVLFWDLGGVLLSNGWDREARRLAVDRFGLDAEDYRERHELVVGDFETGRISLDRYLSCTVFHAPRDFSASEFTDFMFGRSEGRPEVLSIVRRVHATGRYRLATLNNESFELNRYRIEKFELRRYFEAFFCSCILGFAKPEETIYRIAHQVMQREPSECLFIDDRALNIESAEKLGMRTIRYRDPDQLVTALERNGVELEGS